MDRNALKRLLAGLSIAGLLSGAGLVSPPAAFGSSS
jgi:radical SAM modification target selenobiotic family peptide